MNLYRAFLLSSLFVLSNGAAMAQTDVSPQSLLNYAYCMEQATESNVAAPGDFIHADERGTVYRCRDEVAIAYYEALGRKRGRVSDRFVSNETGSYTLRPILNVGYCWHMTKDADGSAVSFWGCDLHVAF